MKRMYFLIFFSYYRYRWVMIDWSTNKRKLRQIMKEFHRKPTEDSYDPSRSQLQITMSIECLTSKQP
jgi:hypothetical protein